MITISRIDSGRLKTAMSETSSKLGIPMRTVVDDTSSQVMTELVTGSNPKNLAKAKAKARIENKKAFYQKPPRVFTGRKAAQSKMQKIAGNTRWLYAAPRVLVGINPENVKGSMDVKEMVRLKKAQVPGAKWAEMGVRGRQDVMIVKKPMVTGAAIKRLDRYTEDQFGKLKASFAVGKDAVTKKVRIPKWVSKHIEGGKVRGGYENHLHDPSAPSFTIISAARGCTGEASRRNIARVLKAKPYKMAKDLKNQLRGLYRKAGFKMN